MTVQLPLAWCACLTLLLLVAAATQAQTAYRRGDKNGKGHYPDQPPPPAEAGNFRKDCRMPPDGRREA